MEERHGDQCGRLDGWGIALFREKLQDHRGLADIVHGAGNDAEMIRIRPLRAPGRTGCIEDGGKVIRADLAEYGHGRAACRPYRGQTFRRLAVIEDHKLRGMLYAIEPGRTRGIGEDELAFAKVDSVSEFFPGPPAIEQCRTATGHENAHVGDDPVRRIAGRKTNAVTLFNSMQRGKTVGDMAGSVPYLAEGHADVAIDDERIVFLFVTEMREVMDDAGRCVLERGHLHAAACHFCQFEHLAGRGDGIGDAMDVLVEFCRHRS